MNALNNRLLIFFSIVYWTLPTFASFDGAKVDLKKFLNSATAAFKSQNLPITSKPSIFFRDAAFATDTEVLFDGAMLYVLGDKTPLIDGYGTYAYGYRFMPSTGKSELVLIQQDIQNSRIIVPEALLIRMKIGASNEDFLRVYQDLMSRLDGSKFNITPLKRLKQFAIDLSNPSASDLIELFSKVQNVDGVVSLNAEKYRTEFEFGMPQRLPSEGVVNFDKLRNVVPKYLNLQGKSFKTDQSKLPTYICAALF